MCRENEAFAEELKNIVLIGCDLGDCDCFYKPDPVLNKPALFYADAGALLSQEMYYRVADSIFDLLVRGIGLEEIRKY